MLDENMPSEFQKTAVKCRMQRLIKQTPEKKKEHCVSGFVDGKVKYRDYLTVKIMCFMQTKPQKMLQSHFVSQIESI